MDTGRVFVDGSCHGNLLLLGNRDTLFRGPISLLSMEENSKRRPFFSSSEDLIDDEFYDEQLPEKKRRLTPDQVQLLEKSFEAENKLEPERKTQLAKKLGLQPRQVAVWFQNRRARWKTKQLERDYDLLKASYDSLLSDFQTVSKDNEKLKSEVVSLTEKLQAHNAVTTAASAVGQESGKLVLGDNDTAVLVNVKAEDRLSSGSGGSNGSAVVDEIGLQLVDSGDSYFAQDYGHCMDPIDGVQSEEDDGSDDGRSYFSDVFAAAAAAAEHHQQEEAVQLGWWDWS